MGFNPTVPKLCAKAAQGITANPQKPAGGGGGVSISISHCETDWLEAVHNFTMIELRFFQ